MRVPMAEQPVEKRVQDFSEVPFGYTENQAVSEAKRCLQCTIPACSKHCPVNVDIKAFIKKIAQNKFKEAFLKIKESCPIPAVAGRVCPQENQCEGACSLGKKYDPVNIGKLESFIADWAMKNNIKPKLEIREKKLRVAVIGSGPAGISCAVDLRKYGYAVTVFEALHKAGGVLQYGIPNFRLPKNIVDSELKYLQDLGIEIKLNLIIGQNVTFEELLRQYDALFIGTGAGAPIFLGIKGEELNGLYSANEFLFRTNLMKAYLFPKYDTPIIVGRKVGVIGAGNVAIDAARCALRLGAEVYILYRRTQEHSPARKEELRHALEEGIHFIELVNPVKIIGENGWIKSVELVKMKLGEPDKSGRPNPVEVADSNFSMDMDTVIIALGTTPNRLFLSRTKGLHTLNKGSIWVNNEYMTNLEGVTAGGDAIGGRATVIEAMGEGKKAAETLHNYLSV